MLNYFFFFVNYLPKSAIPLIWHSCPLSVRTGRIGPYLNVYRRCRPTIYYFFRRGNKKLVRPGRRTRVLCRFIFFSANVLGARNRAVAARRPIDIYGTLHATRTPSPPLLPVTPRPNGPGPPETTPPLLLPNVINGRASPAVTHSPPPNQLTPPKKPTSPPILRRGSRTL